MTVAVRLGDHKRLYTFKDALRFSVKSSLSVGDRERYAGLLLSLRVVFEIFREYGVGTHS